MRDGPTISDDFSLAGGDEFGPGLAEDVRARVKAELEPGERLLWAARSSPPPATMGVGYFIAAGFALVFLALGILILGQAMSHSRAQFNRESEMPVGITVTLAGCLIVATAIGIRVSEVLAQGRQARSYYALTDRRAIAWIPEPKGDAIRVRSLPRGQIRSVTRIERPDGSGTLEFILSPGCPDYYFHGTGMVHIPEVRRVEQIVRNFLVTPAKPHEDEAT